MTEKRGRRYTESELIRAAYLAGAGSSAGEIAEALGHGASAQNVYALLSRHGLRLVPKTRTQVAFPLCMNRELFETIAKAALRRDADPQTVAGRILEQVAFDTRSLHEHVALATREIADATASAPAAVEE